MSRDRVRGLLLAGLLAVGLGTNAPVARAGPAVDFTSFTNNLNNGIGYSLGFEFHTNQDTLVSSLGFFNGNGMAESHAVGIFDNSGTLLTSTTVAPGDPLQGFFRYHDLATPVLLPAGQNFRVAGVTGTRDTYTWDPSGFVVDPSISFVGDRYAPSSTLVNPTLAEGLVGFFGPNFQVAPVPEPSTLTLWTLGALGALGYGWLRRKRAAA
jgi:hypothetical protein